MFDHDDNRIDDNNHDDGRSEWLNEAEVFRFRSKLIADGDGCWLWKSPLDKDGYGTFYLRKRARKAHRVAWYWWFGDIPAGHVINHRCQQRACVNPQHLELVTVEENVFRNSRSRPALNRAKTHCPRGHPYDRVYGGQRYCSICDNAKRVRLSKAWKAKAAETKC